MKKPILIIVAVIVVILAAGAWHWWNSQMEQKYTAVPHFSLERIRQPYLAASQLLKGEGWKVEQSRNLEQALGAKPGSLLILPATRQPMATAQSNRLLEWIEAGGIAILPLVQRPDQQPTTADAEAPPTDHPLLANLHIQLTAAENHAKSAVKLPWLSYPLFLSADGIPRLVETEDTPPPDWADDNADYFASYTIGKGQLIVTSSDHWFNNEHLQLLDHGQFLGELATHAPHKEIWLVSHIDTPFLLSELMQQYGLSILAVLAALGLCLWRLLWRFGPLLPESQAERRAVLEHIQASGRWLWRSQGGPERLLASMREATLEHLRRRMPELTILPPSERVRMLAKRFDLNPEQLDRALNQPLKSSPQAHPHDFAQRIQLLHQLRKTP